MRPNTTRVVIAGLITMTIWRYGVRPFLDKTFNKTTAAGE